MAKKTATPRGLTCPYTGLAVDIVVAGCAGVEQAFIGRVSTPYGSYSTSAFPTREALVYFLSHRDGVPAPGVPATPSKIEVRERTPPAPDAFADIRARQGELNETADAFVERVSAAGK